MTTDIKILTYSEKRERNRTLRRNLKGWGAAITLILGASVVGPTISDWSSHDEIQNFLSRINQDDAKKPILVELDNGNVMMLKATNFTFKKVGDENFVCFDYSSAQPGLHLGNIIGHNYCGLDWEANGGIAPAPLSSSIVNRNSKKLSGLAKH